MRIVASISTSRSPSVVPVSGVGTRRTIASTASAISASLPAQYRYSVALPLLSLKEDTYHSFTRAFMALLGMQDVSIAFGGPPVLDHARFAIERGERVCLLGRNGAGKSTIMKLLDGSLRADDGEIVRQSGMTVARLEQEIPDDVEGTTFDVVSAGLGEAGRLLSRYHDVSHRVALGDEAALREMGRLHQALDTANAWEIQTRVDTVLLHLNLDADAPFASLSGGRKRQALLARALVGEPDLLLLDEPTNHLDIEAVE